MILAEQLRGKLDFRLGLELKFSSTVEFLIWYLSPLPELVKHETIIRCLKKEQKPTGVTKTVNLTTYLQTDTLLSTLYCLGFKHFPPAQLHMYSSSSLRGPSTRLDEKREFDSSSIMVMDLWIHFSCSWSSVLRAELYINSLLFLYLSRTQL